MHIRCRPVGGLTAKAELKLLRKEFVKLLEGQTLAPETHPAKGGGDRSIVGLWHVVAPGQEADNGKAQLRVFPGNQSGSGRVS